MEIDVLSLKCDFHYQVMLPLGGVSVRGVLATWKATCTAPSPALQPVPPCTLAAGSQAAMHTGNMNHMATRAPSVTGPEQGTAVTQTLAKANYTFPMRDTDEGI